MTPKLYRVDIDFLRAISVIAVVIYHADFKYGNFHFLKGGFLGVDIFFVISGFLITKILIEEKIGLLFFFEKRIRRIFPLLIFVLIATYFFAWKHLYPEDLIFFSESIISSILFISNYFFWIVGQQYGAQTSSNIPLLHTWSLGIEIQFYIIFPLILLFFFKYFKKIKIILFIFIFIISIIIAEYLSRKAPAFNFYIFLSRLWEFLLGTFSYWVSNKINNKVYKDNYNIIVNLSFVLILSNFFIFSNVSRLPSLLTLFCLIPVTLILIVNNQKNQYSTLINFKGLIFIGKISYSLYLIHYPIFAFINYTEFTVNISSNFILNDIYNKLFLILFCIILSTISYHFIENIFRKPKKIPKKSLFIFLILSYSVLFALSIKIITNQGFKNRFENFFYSEKIIKRKIFNFSQDNQCMDKDKKVCVFNKKGTKGSLILIGDSQMQGYQSILKEFSYKNNLKLTIAISYGEKNDFLFKNYEKYKSNINKDLTTYLDDLMYSNQNIIIIGGRWQTLLSSSLKDENGKKNEIEVKKEIIKQFIEKLISKNNKVILIYPLPETDFEILPKLNEFYKNNKERPKYIYTFSYDKYKEKNFEIINFLNHFNEKNIFRVYPDRVFCDNHVSRRCIAHDDKSIFYDDTYHLSLDGVKLVSYELLNKLNELF